MISLHTCHISILDISRSADGSCWYLGQCIALDHVARLCLAKQIISFMNFSHAFLVRSLFTSVLVRRANADSNVQKFSVGDTRWAQFEVSLYQTGGLVVAL